jgi:hypothetical protein
MKLIKFNAATAKGFNSGEPIIRFHASGVVTLSKQFVDEAGLSIGDKVSVVQDGDDPDAWYLVTGDEEGFELREYTGNRELCFNNAYICKSLIRYIEANTKSIAFKIAVIPTEHEDDELCEDCKLYAILISSAKYHEIEEKEAVEED